MSEAFAAERIDPGKQVYFFYAPVSPNFYAVVELYWYKPGNNTPARKQTFVRKVQSGQDIYIVGAGVYME